MGPPNGFGEPFASIHVVAEMVTILSLFTLGLWRAMIITKQIPLTMPKIVGNLAIMMPIKMVIMMMFKILKKNGILFNDTILKGVKLMLSPKGCFPN